MTTNKKRVKVWRIGSFTKNFRWGKEIDGLKRLYDAINVGFSGKLHPVLRSTFRDRLRKRGFIDYIPANFFVFNQNINGEDLIVVDELVYQAVKFDHTENFDRLAIFALLLSEAGKWKGATQEQENPSEWARFFVLEDLSQLEKWTPDLYSADRIESYLNGKKEFEGNTRKLATNLSYFFNKGNLSDLREIESPDWFSSAIFLALDRYYLKSLPPAPSVGWAIDALTENDVVDLTGPMSEFQLEMQKSIAKLYLSVHQVERFQGDGGEVGKTIFAVLNRNPALIKSLPGITQRWLESRLFVEIFSSKDEMKKVIDGNYQKEIQLAVEKIHNSLPKPSLSGDDVIALFRGEDDNN